MDEPRDVFEPVETPPDDAGVGDVPSPAKRDVSSAAKRDVFSPAKRDVGLAATGGSGATPRRPGVVRLLTSTFFLSLLACLLHYAAFPPLSWWPLAFVAPAPWIYIAQDHQRRGWKAYGAVYFTAFLLMLLMFEGVRHSHIATTIGWPFLAAYLALYPLAFVWLTRAANTRLRIPIMVAAPVVWVGLELARGHILTGISMALISHPLAAYPPLIQLADLGGAYAVSFVVVLVAASSARMAPLLPRVESAPSNQRFVWWPVVAAILVLGGTIGYGYWRLSTALEADAEPSLRIALIQSSRDTTFGEEDQTVGTFEKCLELTKKAHREHGPLDLVVWPESMFGWPYVELAEGAKPPPEFEEKIDDLRGYADERNEAFLYHAMLASKPEGNTPGAPVLLCGYALLLRGYHMEHFNTVFLVSVNVLRGPQILGRYDKVHPVMFGEALPFGDVFPWLYDLTPLPRGMSIGDGPRSFAIRWTLNDADVARVAPTICYENTVPHLVNRQVNTLIARTEEPDVLVNQSNDGWFYGSAMLDYQLMCGQFRAVEQHKPMVIAANTGISAWIDGSGRIVKRAPKRQEAVILAEPVLDNRPSVYRQIGDWPWAVCLALTAIFSLAGFVPWLLRK